MLNKSNTFIKLDNIGLNKLIYKRKSKIKRLFWNSVILRNKTIKINANNSFNLLYNNKKKYKIIDKNQKIMEKLKKFKLKEIQLYKIKIKSWKLSLKRNYKKKEKIIKIFKN